MKAKAENGEVGPLDIGEEVEKRASNLGVKDSNDGVQFANSRRDASALKGKGGIVREWRAAETDAGEKMGGTRAFLNDEPAGVVLRVASSRRRRHRHTRRRFGLRLQSGPCFGLPALSKRSRDCNCSSHCFEVVNRAKVEAKRNGCSESRAVHVLW